MSFKLGLRCGFSLGASVRRLGEWVLEKKKKKKRKGREMTEDTNVCLFGGEIG